jgi:hypothetical protein
MSHNPYRIPSRKLREKVNRDFVFEGVWWNCASWRGRSGGVEAQGSLFFFFED